jgi:hypothetical protein
MAIEFTQIHNVVRTYQWAIHLPPSAEQDIEQTAHVGADQISISLDSREQNGIHLQDEVLGVTD